MKVVLPILLLVIACHAFGQTHINNEPSKKSESMTKILNSIHFKEKQFDKMLAGKVGRSEKPITIKGFSKNLIKTQIIEESFSALTVSQSESTQQHIIYFHGGAYMLEAGKGEAKLVERFVKNHGFKVTIINYPTTPKHQANKCISVSFKLYQRVLEKFPDDTFFILGDSAGGGLALAILQMQRDAKLEKTPTKSAIVSPWLDLGLSNPEISNYMDGDVVLEVEGLRACGELYRGSMNESNPLVSPIHAHLNALPPVRVYVSDSEIFYPDCLLLHKKYQSTEINNFELIVFHSMMHDWILLPIPESEETIKNIAEYFMK